MHKILLSTFLGLGLTASLQAQTRYISVTGTDVANDCSIPGNPCASISYAVTQALDGDTIMVGSGTYAFAASQLIDKSVIVTGQDSLLKPVITAAAQDVLQVMADSVTITNLRIEMGLTAADGLRGIVASGNYSGLTIDNNEIISTKIFTTGMVFGSYAVLASGGTGQTITISNNLIEPLDSARDAHGRGLGIGLNGSTGPGAFIHGNTVRSFYNIQSIVNTADLVCNDNWFTGSVLIGYPDAGTTVTFTNNTFDAYNDQIADNLVSLLELRSFDDSAAAMVQGNQFIKYKNIGLFSSACRNITVLGNVFSPSDSASDFVSIAANTKIFTTGVQNDTYSNEIDIKGNTFNAGLDSMGTAIVFADHYGVTTPAFEDTIMVGGPGANDKNIFDPAINYFIVLDSASGPSNSISFWAGNFVSTMVPFSQSVYALAAYNEYTITDTIALEEKMSDSLEIAGLGKVILFDSLVVTATNTFEYTAATTFPNPSQAYVTMHHNNLSGSAQISIFDIEGKLVHSVQQTVSNGSLTIPVSQLNKGNYIFVLQNNKKLYHSRFIKE